MVLSGRSPPHQLGVFEPFVEPVRTALARFDGDVPAVMRDLGRARRRPVRRRPGAAARRAVLGQSFDVHLAGALVGLDGESLLAAAEDVLLSGLLVERSASSVAFSHGLVASAV